MVIEFQIFEPVFNYLWIFNSTELSRLLLNNLMIYFEYKFFRYLKKTIAILDKKNKI